VGDSEGLLVTSDAVIDLTRGQKRKPLVGSGKSEPHPFFIRRKSGTIVLAMDGVFKYTRATGSRSTPIAELAHLLISAVRLPSGDCRTMLGSLDIAIRSSA
jgi:hypothetical protein